MEPENESSSSGLIQAVTLASTGLKAKVNPRIIWAIILGSLAIHASCLVLSHTWLSQWRWVHHPVHASVEIAGSLIALAVAVLLLVLDQRKLGTSYNVWISGALVGMGLLDGLHALVYAGQTFVWLHTFATLVGGCLFSCVWLPARWADKVARWWTLVIMTFVLVIGVTSMVLPQYSPAMLTFTNDGSKVFSSWAVGMNVGGGILLLIASIRMTMIYFKRKNTDDLLFSLHCVLFGAAAIMFQQSQLWDLTWWGWHVLRFLAYAVALWFLVLTVIRDHRAVMNMSVRLENANQVLETRVAERTAELRVSNEGLEKSNIELRQFAYVASHDLQSPLRAIHGFAQILVDDHRGELNDEAKDYLDRITSAASRMQSLINDLLSYSRVQGDASEFEPVSLQDVVADVMSLLEAQIEEASAQINVPQLPTVQGEKAHLVQLFQNLVGNSIKYCDTQQPRVDIDASRNNGHWEISIRDNGIGIAPEHQEKVFEIFRRLHTAGEYPGTGIGLAICRRIVDRHGGSIWIESDGTQGTTIKFSLPARSK